MKRSVSPSPEPYSESPNVLLSRTRWPNSIVRTPSELMKSASTKLLIVPWTTATPPSLAVTDETTSLTFAKMPASSAAVTVSVPPAVASESSSEASAVLDTLLEARIPPAARPVAPYSAPAAESAALETVALSWAALSASIVTSPPASIVAADTSAAARAGCWPSKALEISGSPSSASIALKRMFSGFQPSALNAIRKP